MSTIDPIVATTIVTVAADVAFEIFVEEVDRWWRPGPYYWNDPARATGIRFERGVGGRWLELWDLLGDEVFVMGEITGWEPGVTLAMTYRTVSLGNRGYPVEILFANDEGGTTVTLHHGGWEVLGDEAEVARDRYARGWETMLGWFQNWANWGSPRRLGSITRQAYVLQPGEGVDGNTALKASRRSTLGSLSITDSVTVGGAPVHQHRYDDEVFYVLEGILLVTMNGIGQRVPAGGVAFIPRGVPHAWDTDGEARLLIITAPGGLEEFLTALHTWPAGYADAWRVLGERHGYELV
jgi:mannose-6-phosphate isomerase-like protein (cupin superfamily)/uncharacterized protein YndB with AHSA1/START domain